MLRRAIFEMDGPVAVRYPRGCDGTFMTAARQPLLRPGKDITLVGYGALIENLLAAAALLEQQGVSAEVIKLDSVKPIDMEAVRTSVRKTRRLLVAEEAVCIGCAGKEIAARLRTSGIVVPTRLINLGDRFVPHGSVGQLRQMLGLDAKSLALAAQEVVSGGK